MPSYFNVIKLLIATLIICLLSGCGHAPVVDPEITALTTTPQSQWRPQIFISYPDWLGMNIDPVPVDQIRQQLERISGTSLKSRGETHITVFSPVEYKKIQSKMDMTELELVAHQMDIQKTTWTPICVARGVDQKNSGNVTWYIVVEAKGLLELRREVLRRFVKNGGNPADFDPANFYPHITIGFTDRDLFYTDGVIKDSRNCSFDLVTPEGQKITSWTR